MRKTIIRILILSFILIVGVLQAREVDAVSFSKEPTMCDDTYVVQYGKEIELQLGNDEKISSDNPDIAILGNEYTITARSTSNSIEIRAIKLKINGVGHFTLTVKNGNEEEKINFFAWNVYVRRGKFHIYNDVDRKDKDKVLRSKVYLATSNTTNKKSLKIEDHLFAGGKYDGTLDGKYIKNYYKRKSKSKYFKFSFNKEFSDTDEEIGNTIVETNTIVEMNTVGETNTVGESPTPTTDLNEKMEIHFISTKLTVDAIYIKVGDKSMFVDGGHYYDADSEIEYLKKLGVTHIDYYICSHSDNNHVGAGGPIIYNFGVEKIYLGREKKNGRYASYNTIITAIENKAKKSDLKEKMLAAVKKCEVIVVKPDDSFSINNLKIKCLGPVKLFNVDKDENENSIVLKMQFGEKSFLLPGDMEKSGWVEIIKQYKNELDVDLMKHPHHGHTSSTKVEWYKNYFKPNYVIFTTSNSCIPKSSYTSKLKSYGMKYYVTAANKDGNVLVKCDGKNIEVKTKNKP